MGDLTTTSPPILSVGSLVKIIDPRYDLAANTFGAKFDGSDGILEFGDVALVIGVTETPAGIFYDVATKGSQTRVHSFWCERFDYECR